MGYVRSCVGEVPAELVCSHDSEPHLGGYGVHTPPVQSLHLLYRLVGKIECLGIGILVRQQVVEDKEAEVDLDLRNGFRCAFG